MSPCTLNFGPNWSSPLQKRRFPIDIRSYSASALRPSEKSSIMTNRKSTTSFPMSLRWTAYVAHKPQKGAQKRKLTIFLLKVYFSRRKSAAKFLCVNTFSSKVVRYSLAYLAVHKGLVGDVPFYLKFLTKVTHPLLKRRFPIYVYSLVARQPQNLACSVITTRFSWA